VGVIVRLPWQEGVVFSVFVRFDAPLQDISL
jgi:hypothetical protein